MEKQQQRPHFDPQRQTTQRQRRINAVYHYLETTGITQDMFARMLGGSKSGLNRFLRHKGDIYLSTWELMEAALIRAGINWRDY